MPSILTEVSFLSDPAEAKRLESPKYIDHIALALADGIAGYLTAEGPVAAAVTTASVP
jgi:N-acetylmuramoyl-L-alanine amidase